MPRLVWMFEIAFVVEVVVAAAAVVVSKIKHHLEQKKKNVYFHFFNYFVIDKHADTENQLQHRHY